jgi:hypothetical protein
VKLCDDAFPELGMSRRIRGVNTFEHDTGGMESLAVTGDAVFVENSLDVSWIVEAELKVRRYALWSYTLWSRRLDGRQRSSHPAANGEREDRRTAFHGMCARCAA